MDSMAGAYEQKATDALEQSSALLYEYHEGNIEYNLQRAQTVAVQAQTYAALALLHKEIS